MEKGKGVLNLEDEVIVLLPVRFEEYLESNGLKLDWLDQHQRNNLVDLWSKLKVAECDCIISKATFHSFLQHLKLQIYKQF